MAPINLSKKCFSVLRHFTSLHSKLYPNAGCVTTTTSPGGAFLTQSDFYDKGKYSELSFIIKKSDSFRGLSKIESLLIGKNLSSNL